MLLFRLSLCALACLGSAARVAWSAPATDDRAAAEWVVHVGGSVTFETGPPAIRDIAAFPAGPVWLKAVDLVSVVIPPEDLQRLSGLTHLRELYLSGRTWHSLPPDIAVRSLASLAGLTTLEKLVLSLPVQTEIPVKDDAIVQLAPLKNLRELRLAQTQVKGRTLVPFTELRALDLDHTQLNDEGMASIAGMKHLTKFYARDTLITDEGLRNLAGLKELTELDLYGTRITDEGLHQLSGLVRLTKLNILGASVTDAGLDSLAALKNLRELNLYRTGITNAGLEKLRRFPELRRLDLRYTNVSAAGLARLRGALPSCHILFLDSGTEQARSNPKGKVRPIRGDVSSIETWVKARGGKVRAGEISLSGARVEDADVTVLASYPGLGALNLESTEIGDASLSALSSAKQLKSLNLAHTMVTDAGLNSVAGL